MIPAVEYLTPLIAEERVKRLVMTNPACARRSS